MSSSFADRPPPDPSRFLAALDEWRRDEVTAGTTMQTLKRGGLDALLTSTSTNADALKEAWEDWERGRSTPDDTLTRLDEAGLAAFLADAADAAAEEVAP